MQNDQKRARQIVARGVSAWERDDFESALETFQGVLVDFPQFADVQNKAALQYNPAYAEAHLNRGIILNDLGRHEEDQLSL
jgi:tetratricopeptide (TPR) repeat protein